MKRPKMRGLDGYRVPYSIKPELRDTISDDSNEVDVNRIAMHYDDFGKTVDGLVLRTFKDNLSSSEVEEKMKDVIEQWKRIKSINRRRKKEGKTVFRLPPSVRVLEGDRPGILMTDLSKGGWFDVWDMKDIEAMAESWELDEGTWRQIKVQIERDIQIAQEEGLWLASGPNQLDPWLVIYNREHNRPEVYLADIGSYTGFEGAKDGGIEYSTTYLKRGLASIDRKLNSNF